MWRVLIIFVSQELTLHRQLVSIGRMNELARVLIVVPTSYRVLSEDILSGRQPYNMVPNLLFVEGELETQKGNIYKPKPS